MTKRRVVITGIGALTPIRNTAKETWENALNGVNGIDKITRFDNSEFNIHVAGELKDFNIEDYLDKKEARRMDRFTQYAVVASDEAVKDSGLVIDENNDTRVGVWIGSGIGGIQALQDGLKVLCDSCPSGVSPFIVLQILQDVAC